MIPARPTPEQLSTETRARVCNGIGPAYGTSGGSRVAYVLAAPLLWLAGRVGILAAYASAGDQHDLLYAVGGLDDEKREADGRFLADLTKLTSRWPLLLRPCGWAISVLFWVAVSLGGWGSFRLRVRSPYWIGPSDARRPRPVAELVELVTKEASP